MRTQITNSISDFLKIPLKVISVAIILYLQKKYKSISIKNRDNCTTSIIAKLILIQNILYFFKTHFHAWGFFHPDCVWTEKDEKYFRNLFPQKDFEEINIVVWHNPNAVTYYHNKIWELSKQSPPIYENEIKKQLIKWKEWN